MESYVERPPLPELAHAVRTVWIQRTGQGTYVQRHLPTGGVELQLPIGGEPRVLGPLTYAQVEVIAPGTTIIGVRFRPGCTPSLATGLHDLVNQRVALAELWGAAASDLVDMMALAESADRALLILQTHLLDRYRRRVDADLLIEEAARALMPWHPVHVGALSQHLALSQSQLRRRCLQVIGLTPKTLQRTLRFQGFLALAQAAAAIPGRPDDAGLAGLAMASGYADQAHLSRECLRLTGLTPQQLLGGAGGRCTCGHDHSASYESFLPATRRPNVAPMRMHDSFKTRPVATPILQAGQSRSR